MGVTFAVAISHILFDLSWLLLFYHLCFFCDLCCIWRLLWFMRSTVTILRVDSGEMNPKRFQAVSAASHNLENVARDSHRNSISPR